MHVNLTSVSPVSAILLGINHCCSHLAWWSRRGLCSVIGSMVWPRLVHITLKSMSIFTLIQQKETLISFHFSQTAINVLYIYENDLDR